MPAKKRLSSSRVLFPVLSFAVSAMACGCGGGGDGDSPPPPAGGSAGTVAPGNPSTPGNGTTSSQFSGNYDVAYAGDGQGGCSVQILADGVVRGECVEVDGVARALQGTVTDSGSFLSTLGSLADGAQFVGTLSGHAGSGTWTSPGKAGTWTLGAPAVAVAALPDLARPESASTAAVGDGLEGVWRSAAGELLLLTPEPRRLFLAAASSGSADSVRGSYAPVFTATGGSFQLNADAFGFSAGRAASAEVGEASFTRRKTLGFSYRRADGTGPLGDYTATYEPLNAQAVTLADLAGPWADADTPDLRITPDGTLQGRTAGATLGTCTLAGQVAVPVVGASRNLFDVSFTAAAVAGAAPECKLAAGAPYTGHAFLRVVNLGVAGQPYYKHSLQVVVAQGSAGTPVVLAPQRR